MFDDLAADGRGLPAIAGFFERLVAARCAGEHATGGRDRPEVRQVLEAHHDELRAAMRTALRTALQAARAHDQLRPDVNVEAGAQTLALLAYGVNLRSRAGAEPADLLAGVHAVLDGFTRTEER